jgi:hypothetical protein
MISRIFAAFLVTVFISGCAGIKGVKNTNLYDQIPKNAKYSINLEYGDDITGAQIQKMLDYQLQQLGLSKIDDPKLADVVVRYGFDVKLVGKNSTAFTTVQPGKSTATIIGNTAYIKSRPSTATTFVSDDDEFEKSIQVLIQSQSGKKLWEGKVSEKGWCNQIFVTAPHIFALMFENFPEPAINIREMVANNSAVERYKAIFPKNTNWGCR